MNSIVYSGRLTAEIETRAAGEQQVHRFTVAVNQGERTTFVPSEAWNMPHLSNYLGKGSPVLVRGALKQENWETAEGQKRSRLVVTAHEVEFVGERAENGTKDRPASSARPSEARASKSPGRRPPSTVREELAAYGA
jgi:single-strand DNA-binding protein